MTVIIRMDTNHGITIMMEIPIIMVTSNVAVAAEDQEVAAVIVLIWIEVVTVEVVNFVVNVVAAAIVELMYHVVNHKHNNKHMYVECATGIINIDS